MKKFYFGCLMAVFALTVQSCKKAEDVSDTPQRLKTQSGVKSPDIITGDFYYNEEGRKVSVSNVPNKLVLFDPDSNAVFKKLSVTGSSLEKLRSGFSLLISESKIDTSLFSKNSIKHYVLKTTLGHELIPTGEITLRPKSGISVESIINAMGKNVLSVVRKSRLGGYLLKLQDHQSILQVANKIYESGLVEYSQPNFIGAWQKYSEPYFGNQYYLKNLGNAYYVAGMDINLGNTVMGLSEVKVAVTDEGVGPHEEFTNGRLLTGFTANNPSGYGAPLSSTSYHGQAVAGIIGASSTNNLGIAGIAPNAKIIPVNVFGPGVDDFDKGEAITWAWQTAGADVISITWGAISGYSSPDITNAIASAISSGRGGKGCVVVAAAGNEAYYRVSYPANLPNVISVGAIDGAGQHWIYSNTSNWSSTNPEDRLELVAPSGNYGSGLGNIYTIDQMGTNGSNSGNYLMTFGGTSAAAPQVAGAAAILLSYNSNLTSSQVYNYLINNATDMGASGFDNTFGYGRLNISKTLARLEYDRAAPLASQIYAFSKYPATPSHYLSSNTTVSGWTYDGSAFKAFSTTTTGAQPVYEFYGNYPDGRITYFYQFGTSQTGFWHLTGIKFYAFPTQVPGTVPVYGYMNAWDQDHTFTTANYDNSYYTTKWIAFYTYPNTFTY